MIIRMCGRCQEEIYKERNRASKAENELEQLKIKYEYAIKIAQIMIEERSDNNQKVNS